MDIDKIDLSAVENREVRSYESRFESFRKLNSKLNDKFLEEFAEKFIVIPNPSFEHTIDIIMFRLLDYKYGCKSRSKAYQNEVKEVYRYIVKWGA